MECCMLRADPWRTPSSCSTRDNHVPSLYSSSFSAEARIYELHLRSPEKALRKQVCLSCPAIYVGGTSESISASSRIHKSRKPLPHTHTLSKSFSLDVAVPRQYVVWKRKGKYQIMYYAQLTAKLEYTRMGFPRVEEVAFPTFSGNWQLTGQEEQVCMGQGRVQRLCLLRLYQLLTHWLLAKSCHLLVLLYLLSLTQDTHPLVSLCK